MRLLEPGHLEEDYPITTVFENKRFSSLFANGSIKLKVQLRNRWKLWTRFNLPDLPGNGPQIYECYWPVCKKLRIFCFQKPLWFDNLPSAPVPVVALWKGFWTRQLQSHEGVNIYSSLLNIPQETYPIEGGKPLWGFYWYWSWQLYSVTVSWFYFLF